MKTTIKAMQEAARKEPDTRRMAAICMEIYQLSKVPPSKKQILYLRYLGYGGKASCRQDASDIIRRLTKKKVVDNNSESVI